MHVLILEAFSLCLVPLRSVISNMQLLHISDDRLTGDQNGALQYGSMSWPGI